MKRKRIILAVLFGCFILMLTACGSKTSGENYDQGMSYLEKGKYKKAISAFKLAIEDEERLPESYRGLGIASLKTEQYGSAIAAFSRSINSMDVQNEDFEKDVKLYLASARLAYGETDKAIEVYTEILDSYDDPECHYFRGKAYLQMDDYENAAVDFEAAAAKSTDYDMFLSIYQAYADAKMTADGSKFLEEALKLEVKTAEDYYNQGRIYYCLSDYENAKKDLIKAISEGYPDAELLLGKVYLAMEDVSNARAMYQEYASKNGESATAYNGLALCDITEQKYDGALDNIQKGIDLNDEGELKSLLYNQILVYEYKLDFDTAKTKMKAYLEKYPDDEVAQRENSFLETR